MKNQIISAADIDSPEIEEEDPRETKDQEIQPDKETDLDKEKQEEQVQEKDEKDKRDAKDELPNNGEMNWDEEEEGFESDAAAWEEKPEVDLPNKGALLNLLDAEEVLKEGKNDEIRDEVEEDHDEFFGLSAPDKMNPEIENEDIQEQQVDGEGKEGEKENGQENSEEKALEMIEMKQRECDRICDSPREPGNN